MLFGVWRPSGGWAMHAQRSWLRPLGPAHVREGFRHRPLRSSPLTSEYRHAHAAPPSEVRSLCWRLLSFEGIQTVRWHRTHTSSRFALALLAMLVAPFLEQIWSVGEAAHHAVYVGLSDGLQNNAAKLVFQKLDLSAGGDPVFAAQFRRNHKLALRGKCSTYLFHDLHITTSKAYTIEGGGAIQEIMEPRGSREHHRKPRDVEHPTDLEITRLPSL